SNAIDADPPTSSVQALPATTTNPNFTVTWAGSDGAGSGVASFSVFVSMDGGPFTAWQTNVTQTSATYAGAVGHTYAFYSVATDNVGNVQPTPAAAQATTQVTSGGGGGGSGRGLYAVGAGPGGAPLVKVYNADGSLRFSFLAYD